MKIDYTKIVELSFEMIPGNEVFYLNTKLQDVTELDPDAKHRDDIWYKVSDINFSSHMGTHIEFPFHHWEQGADASNYPIEHLIGEAIVLDFSHKNHKEPISLEEIKKYDNTIKEGDIVFFRTDKDKFWRTDRWREKPYVTEEGMLWLINNKKPKLVGTDAGGIELFGTDCQPNHLNLFKNNIALIESATNLDKITGERVMVFVHSLPIRGIESCPVRIIAIKEEGIINE